MREGRGFRKRHLLLGVRRNCNGHGLKLHKSPLLTCYSANMYFSFNFILLWAVSCLYTIYLVMVFSSVAFFYLPLTPNKSLLFSNSSLPQTLCESPAQVVIATVYMYAHDCNSHGISGRQYVIILLIHLLFSPLSSLFWDGPWDSEWLENSFQLFGRMTSPYNILSLVHVTCWYCLTS